jgi:hypothetical protein
MFRTRANENIFIHRFLERISDCNQRYLEDEWYIQGGIHFAAIVPLLSSETKVLHFLRRRNLHPLS